MLIHMPTLAQDEELKSDLSFLAAMSLMLFNLTSKFKHYFTKNLTVCRPFSSQKTYKVLFFGSDSIALKSFKKINELRFV
jgi:hypothetical protein